MQTIQISLSTVLCEKLLFEGTVFKKVHVSYDISTSTCRMTMISSLTYFLELKEGFRYTEHDHTMTLRISKAIWSESLSQKQFRNRQNRVSLGLFESSSKVIIRYRFQKNSCFIRYFHFYVSHGHHFFFFDVFSRARSCLLYTSPSPRD